MTKSWIGVYVRKIELSLANAAVQYYVQSISQSMNCELTYMQVDGIIDEVLKEYPGRI